MLMGCATRAQPVHKSAQNLGKNNAMNQNNSPQKPVCLGRYLIDVPVDSVVRSSFKFASGILQTKQNLSQADFQRIIETREIELRKTPHKKVGNMFVARTELAPNRILIQSLDSSVSTTIHKNETFVYLAENRSLYTQADTSDAESQLNSVAVARRVADLFKYRGTDEIPTGVGFCINNGLIASKALNREEVSASIDFKKYPTISFSVNSLVTGNPTEGLISRTDRALANEPAALLAAMTILRKGKRNLGPLQAEEILIRTTEDGKRAYAFSWKSEGKADSIEFPAIAIKLTTSDKTDTSGAAVDAPFKTDKEALEFWDDLLGTLRLRPGAV
jgi:hypothetical protein